MNWSPIWYATYLVLFIAAALGLKALIARLRRAFKRRYRRAPKPATPWNDDTDPDIGWTYEIYKPGQIPFQRDEHDQPIPARRAHLLYVGSAKRHPFGRLAEHVTKEWFPDNAWIKVDKHIHYAASHDAEIVKIQDLLPSENKIRYTRKRVTRPALELEPTLTQWIRIERQK